MSYWDETDVEDDLDKWANWTLNPRKPKRSFSTYAMAYGAAILAVCAVVVVFA